MGRLVCWKLDMKATAPRRNLRTVSGKLASGAGTHALHEKRALLKSVPQKLLGKLELLSEDFGEFHEKISVYFFRDKYP